jgi:hypothetical protein
MLTGMDDVDTMRRAFEAGVTFFLGKPCLSRKGLCHLPLGAGRYAGGTAADWARVPSPHSRERCVREAQERFTATSIRVSAEGGMALEGSGAAAVGDVLTSGIQLCPRQSTPMKVTGKIRGKGGLGPDLDRVHRPHRKPAAKSFESTCTARL